MRLCVPVKSWARSPGPWSFLSFWLSFWDHGTLALTITILLLNAFLETADTLGADYMSAHKNSMWTEFDNYKHFKGNIKTC